MPAVAKTLSRYLKTQKFGTPVSKFSKFRQEPNISPSPKFCTFSQRPKYSSTECMRRQKRYNQIICFYQSENNQMRYVDQQQDIFSQQQNLLSNDEVDLSLLDNLSVSNFRPNSNDFKRQQIDSPLENI